MDSYEEKVASFLTQARLRIGSLGKEASDLFFTGDPYDEQTVTATKLLDGVDALAGPNTLTGEQKLFLISKLTRFGGVSGSDWNGQALSLNPTVYVPVINAERIVSFNPKADGTALVLTTNLRTFSADLPYNTPQFVLAPVPDAISARLIEGLADADNSNDKKLLNVSTVGLFQFLATSAAIDDGTTVIKPDDILIDDPGRFVLVSASGSGGGGTVALVPLTQYFAGDGVTATFATSYPIISVLACGGGSLIASDDEFTNDTTGFTLAIAPGVGEKAFIMYQRSIGQEQREDFTVDGTTATFTTAYPIASVLLCGAGGLISDDFTNDSTSFTLSSIPATTEKAFIIYNRA